MTFFDMRDAFVCHNDFISLDSSEFFCKNLYIYISKTLYFCHYVILFSELCPFYVILLLMASCRFYIPRNFM